MKCFNCRKRKGTFYISYLKKYSCVYCLYNMNFRRFKNYSRGRFGKREMIYTMDDGRAPSVLCIHFLKKLFPRRKIVVTKRYRRGVVLPTTVNEETVAFMDYFLKRKRFKYEGIRPMSSMPLNEIEAVCDHLKLDYKKSESKSILDKIERHRPGVWFSVKNTIKAISGRL